MTLHEHFVFRITCNSHILFYDEKALKNKIKYFDIKVLFYTTLYKSYMTPLISLQDAFIFNRIVKGKTKINCFHSKFSGQDLWNWTGDQRKFYRTLIADSRLFPQKKNGFLFTPNPIIARWSRGLWNLLNAIYSKTIFWKCLLSFV